MAAPRLILSRIQFALDALAKLRRAPPADIASVPARLGDLLRAVRSADGPRTPRRLIASAELATDLQVDPATAERMLLRYLLTRNFEMPTIKLMMPITYAARMTGPTQR